MGLSDSIIGSLAANAISEIAREVTKWFSERKKQAQKEEMEQLQKLEADFEQKLEEVKKDVTAKMQVLSVPMEKLFALSQIKSVLEWANGMCKKRTTDKDIQEIRLDLRRPHVREKLEYLAKPMKTQRSKKKYKARAEEINRLTKQLGDVYTLYRDSWDCAGINRELILSNDLEHELITFLREGVEYE